jgi:hypothetical protein
MIAKAGLANSGVRVRLLLKWQIDGVVRQME